MTTMAIADKTVGNVNKARSSERLEQVHLDGSGTLRECSDHDSGSKVHISVIMVTDPLLCHTWTLRDVT